jgi:hypothetical protein
LGADPSPVDDLAGLTAFPDLSRAGLAERTSFPIAKSFRLALRYEV